MIIFSQMIIIPSMSPLTYPYPNCMSFFFFISPLSPGSAVHICKGVGIYWSVGLLPTACIFSLLIFLYS